MTEQTMDLIDVHEIRVARTRDGIVLGESVRPLGGGTWLFSEPQPPEHTGFVDLTALGWTPIETTADHLVVAATCTIRELTDFALDPEWPAQQLFRQCAESLLMSFKIWNLATVGGNVATALPAGAMTSLLAGLGARAVIWGAEGRERRILVSDLVTGVRATDLSLDEVIRSFEIPLASLRSRTAFRRISMSNLGRSAAVVIGRVDATGECVITVTAATPRPVQLRFDSVPEAGELSDALSRYSDWYSDPHGAPDWRRAVSMRFAEEIRAELSADTDSSTGTWSSVSTDTHTGSDA
ncbi:FAD binding domain-containing protein [Frondihabitans sp. 4ASC-45]|uniref:FAD binding domain-containing protein n=1 Tax=Frondihabitans sp. 4ASC-45 TaxID=3111636 RepID=UPI003C2C98AA